jgi:membrane protease YdiL (CAAX protease family)
MYVLTYDTFASVFPWFKDSYDVIGAAALGRILLWQSLAIALCAVPLLRHVDFRAFLLGRASLRATIGWTVLALLLCGIMAVLYGSALQAYHRLAVLGDLTTQAIQWIQSTYGSWAALLLAALLIPVIEELLFRGVLLQALSRYVSVRWAALIQAAVFAGMHQSAQAWPYVFVLGLLGAWLMRRTGGLLAPILLHGVNNALVCGTIFAATASLNAGG